MEILHQLGELFLEAVPTVVIVLLFYVFMRWAFFGPIQKTMAERDARIEGARREAAAVEAEAKQELDTYNEALRKARARNLCRAGSGAAGGARRARQATEGDAFALAGRSERREEEDRRGGRRRTRRNRAAGARAGRSDRPHDPREAVAFRRDRAMICASGIALGPDAAGRFIRSVLVLLLAAARVRAGDQPSPADSSTGWVFRWLNFAIVLAIVIYALRKAAPYFRTPRRRNLREDRRGNARARSRRSGSAARRRQSSPESIRKWRRCARTPSAAHKLKASACARMAKAEAEAIERSAQAEIAAAERAARLELKALAARIAIERAEAVLRAELHARNGGRALP